MRSLPRRAKAITSTLLLTWLLPASAEVFVPNEELASDPTLSQIIDPEYDDLQSRFCWIAEGNRDVDGDEKLWIGYIDPVTGLYDPPDGRAQLVDAGTIIGVTKVGNGCEWVFTDQGPQIVYTKATGPTFRNRAIARATLVDGQWVAGIEDNTVASWGPLGSLDRGDPDPGVSYQKMLNPDVPGDFARAIFVRGLNDPTSERMIPTTDKLFTPGARWIPGTDSVIFTRPMLPGEVPERQVFAYDRITDTLTQLTDDAGTKFAAFMWNAPEYGGEPVFVTLINQVRLGIYRKNADGVWEQASEIDPPLPAPDFIWSPEPFQYEGKSYIVMTMSPSADQQSRTIPTETWIAGIDPDNPFYRRISDDRALVRKDPEAVVVSRVQATEARDVTGDPSDYGLNEAGGIINPANSLIQVGASARSRAGVEGRNAVLVIPLPVLAADEVMERATLSVYVESNIPMNGVNGDVWMLGIGGPNQTFLDYLESDADPNPQYVKISDDWLTSTTATRQRTEIAAGDSAQLATRLMEWYRSNPSYQGGSYLYLRLNPDADMGADTAGWTVRSADNSPDLLPGIRFTIVPRDKPWVYISVGGEIHRLETGLNTSAQ